MQRRGAAGLLLLGLLLGTCLAGSRAQWVCMGGHPPGSGRDRGVQGSPNKTPLTSPDALFYLHHLRSCAMCPVGAVATGGIGTTGGVGWGGHFFVLRWPQPPRVLAVLPGVGIAGGGLAPAGVLLDFQPFLIPFPGRSLGSRLLGYQRPLPPPPLSTLVWGPDVAVAAWLAFLHGETPLPGLGPAQPFPQPEAMQVDSGPPLVRPLLPAGVEEELRAVFGEDMSVDELLRADTGGHHHTCPVVGCCRHAGGNRPGWGTFGSLRAHVDQHLSGELPGRPTESWFQVNRLGCCNVCGLTISTRVQG